MSEITATEVLKATQPQAPVAEVKPDAVKPEVEVQKTESENKDSFSERFALLTQREKRILKEKEEAKALKLEAEKRQKEFEEQSQRWKQFEELKKVNPLKAAALLGLDYNELTAAKLNEEEPTTEYQIKSVKQELEEFKRQQEEQAKKAAEEQRQKLEEQQREVVEQFKSGIKDFVSEKSEDYELINFFDQTDLVYDTIQEYYLANKKVLSLKEGADLVEKYLEEHVKKTTSTKKFKKLYSPESQQESKEAVTSKDPIQPRNHTQPRTLTNNITSSAPSFLPAKTEQERLQRALAALDKTK